MLGRFSDKQARIDQCRIQASAHYPVLWSKMITQWSMSDPIDRVWLTYSANYLFRTNNIRWAIDPLTLNWRIEGAPEVNVENGLHSLSFALLTHDHKDHLDIDLISALCDLPITWIVPECIVPKVMQEANVPREKIIIPVALQPIELNGIHILPFDGLHWEKTSDAGIKRVPATGYLIECNRKRWLFPGDTRTYDVSQLPAFDSVDVLFAHLWLGRGSALMDEPPLLDAFCHFFLDLKPRRLVLTHLNEFGRDVNDFWDGAHMEAVLSRFQELSSNVPVTYTVMGESVLL